MKERRPHQRSDLGIVEVVLLRESHRVARHLVQVIANEHAVHEVSGIIGIQAPLDAGGADPDLRSHNRRDDRCEDAQLKDERRWNSQGPKSGQIETDWPDSGWGEDFR
jgi:hypothetical protein